MRRPGHKHGGIHKLSADHRQQARHRLRRRNFCVQCWNNNTSPPTVATKELPYERSTLMPLPTSDIGFNKWREAAANAKDLLSQGHIDFNEYRKIMARARAEQGTSTQGTSTQATSTQGHAPMQQGPLSAQAQPQQPAQPQPKLDPMNDRALPTQSLPTQSLPTWDRVKRFLKGLKLIPPAY